MYMLVVQAPGYFQPGVACGRRVGYHAPLVGGRNAGDRGAKGITREQQRCGKSSVTRAACVYGATPGRRLDKRTDRPTDN